MTLTLDAGCGKSYPTIVKKHFPNTEAVGLDISKYDNITIVGDAQHLPFRGGAFDNLLMHHTLEHMKDDFSALEEAHRVLKQGGNLCVAVPNYDCHMLIMLRLVARHLVPALGHVINSFLKQRPTCVSKGFCHTDISHYREYTLEQIIHLVKKAHFQINAVRLYGVRLPFVSRALQSDKWHAGKYSHTIHMDAISR